MKKNMAGNTRTGSTHNTGNDYAASHRNYRPKSEGMNDGNWFADHKKLLWGIGGAVALGAGAFIYFKNRNGADEYSDTYDQMNALDQDVMNNLGEDDIVITTISEFE